MSHHLLYTASLAVLLVGSAVSCVSYNQVDDPRFDAVQTQRDRLPLPTHTISQLKALYQSGGVVVDKPIVVSGIIVSDDSEGNLYKSAYIADETGGMELKFGMGNLSSLYPQGTRVRLFCQGLKLGSYGKQINIGWPTKEERYETGFVPELLVPQHLFKEGRGEAKPVRLTIATINKKYAGMLIQLDNVQFAASELGQTYADPIGKETNRNVNRTIVDKAVGQLILRTSSYAKFAGVKLPQGSGTITALLNYFQDEAQLTLLRQEDVQFTSPRF